MEKNLDGLMDQIASNGIQVLAQINIQVVKQGNQVQLMVNSSCDLFTGLGVLEASKDVLKQQAQNPQSTIVKATGQIPRA